MVKTLKISARLKVTAFDAQGRKVAQLSKPVNLLLGNVHKMLAILFFKDYQLGLLPTNTVYPSFTDANNVSRAGNRMRSKDNHALSYIQNENFASSTFNYTGVGYVMLGVGTGTAEPTLQDYTLASEAASGVNPSRVVTVLPDGRFKVTYSITFTFASAINITEAGIWFQFYVNSETAGTSGARWVMLARDVFTAISVPAGGSVAVEYSFTV